MLEGKFVSINSDKTYPNYDRQSCYLDYDMYDRITEDDTIYIGQDFNKGFNKAVAIIVRDGNAYAVKEYTFPDPRRAPEVFNIPCKLNVSLGEIFCREVVRRIGYRAFYQAER